MTAEQETTTDTALAELVATQQRIADALEGILALQKREALLRMQAREARRTRQDNPYARRPLTNVPPTAAYAEDEDDE